MVRCPSCNANLRLTDRSALGKHVQCPKCSSRIRLGVRAPAAANRATPSAPAEDDFLGALDDVTQDEYDFGQDEEELPDDDEFGLPEEETLSPLPARRSPSQSEPASPEEAPKKKRKKKRRKKAKAGFSNTAFGAFLIWVGCGSVGGAIGAAI